MALSIFCLFLILMFSIFKIIYSYIKDEGMKYHTNEEDANNI
jgi:hypothetical protein